MCGITGWVASRHDSSGPGETREHTDDHETTIAPVRELLDDNVRRQLIADVPLLSGGLDSSDASHTQKYVRDAYSTSVSRIERLPGESDFEWQMRRIRYPHLTHFVRIPLDRKDHASMAVGLEVRVPFCAHRLVEYVYNVPWSLKSFDGRQKSLPCAATRDVLPQSVAERVKAPYPSTQDRSDKAMLKLR